MSLIGGIGMGARKIKLDFHTFCEYLSEIGNDYYDYSNTTVKLKNGEVIRGTIYKLSKPLKDEEKEWFMSWKNVKLHLVVSQYAPELKKSAVFIGSKAFKHRE